MAAVNEHEQSEFAKVLLIGNNGSGKTGSLVSLIKAGYKLRVLDFDNGTEILKNLLKAQAPERFNGTYLDIESHSDDYVQQGNGLKPKMPLKGFSGGMKVLSDWPGLGTPATWGRDTVLVLDSLTMMGKFIMNHVLAMNNRLGQQPQLQDWGQAMSLQEDVMAMLFSANFRCHVIVLAHVTFVQPEGEVQQFGYPSALGSKLPPKIGSYFNSTLFMGSEGVGNAKKKVLFTKSKGLIECKTSAPGIVKDSYPIETGLADYFEALFGRLETAQAA